MSKSKKSQLQKDSKIEKHTQATIKDNEKSSKPDTLTNFNTNHIAESKKIQESELNHESKIIDTQDIKNIEELILEGDYSVSKQQVNLKPKKPKKFLYSRPENSIATKNSKTGIKLFLLLAALILVIILITQNLKPFSSQANLTSNTKDSSKVQEREISKMESNVDKKNQVIDNQAMNDKNLIIEDTLVGTGKEVIVGSSVKIHYKGTLLPTEGGVEGAVFDSSYDRGLPLDTPIGVGRLIKGWDIGILGMKEGGKRKLTISPQYAYGSADLGSIPPNSTLVFEVELVEVVK